MLFVSTSYKRTVLSKEETSKNCAELGPNLTDDIPPSGGVFSLNSDLDSVIPKQNNIIAAINLIIHFNSLYSYRSLLFNG
jgi:hypothetical protein